MARVLITGMSGTGKSTVLDVLASRGYLTVDTDLYGWTDGEGGPWDATRMGDLLRTERTVVVSGAAENQGDFLDRFEHVVLLSVPVEVAIERVRTRSNNSYGRTIEEQDRIRRHFAEVEPLLRRSATAELDGRLPLARLADEVAGLADGHPTDARSAVPPRSDTAEE
ncbi:MAG: ATP-binding protein [Actinobacteria bacterium]|nr:ATP-binding protein [Actinomycetota bacterium]